MTLPVERPILQTPPAEYSAEYFKGIIKSLELYIQRLHAVGPVRCSRLHASDLPGDPTEFHLLATGDLFHVAGVVHVMRASDIYFKPVSGATASLGTVTVSTI